MNKILLVLAHPAFEFSRNNKNMVAAATNGENVLIQLRDLYELYPRFNIDVVKEQEMLEQHDIIVFQHPFYWYNVPALMKQYIDTVFTYGWAYGKRTEVLKGKILFNALTTNGSRNSYEANGHNRFPLSDYLIPFNQLAFVSQMHYLPPFVLHESGKADREMSLRHAEKFQRMLQVFSSGDFPIKELQTLKYLNDFRQLEKI